MPRRLHHVSALVIGANERISIQTAIKYRAAARPSRAIEVMRAPDLARWFVLWKTAGNADNKRDICMEMVTVTNNSGKRKLP